MRVMKRILAAFLGIWIISLTVYSQQNDNKLNIKDFKRVELDAVEYFANESYMQALPLYLKLYEDDPSNLQYKYNLSICYLHSPSEKHKAINYLKELSQIPDLSNEIHYYLGKAYHLSFQFETAIKEYELFIASVKDKNPLKKDAMRQIETCKNGVELVKNPIEVTIQNLGSIVNSPYPDYSPAITADERILFFTSRREGTTGGMKGPDNFPFEDIFITTKFEGDWTDPVSIGANINTNGHDACVGVSNDGQQLIIYKDTEGDGNLYSCNKIGDTWSLPTKLGSNINTKAWEPHASLSRDENTIYFTSDRSNGYGLRDIYKATKLPTGEWGLALNLGPTINTEYDEDGPFIHPDDKTFYFSSKGHKSMGGFDIFKSVQTEPNVWSIPENIGTPINTPDDDIYFVLSAGGDHAYYVSAAVGGEGEKDIYLINLPKTEEKLIIMLKGIVLFDGSHMPIPAKIVVTNNQTGEEQVAKVNSYDGQFLAVLQAGHYGISAEATGYLFYSDNINIPQLTEFTEINKVIDLQSVQVGHKIILRNIFFDTGKSDLKQESQIELTKLYNLLTQNPTFEVELSGHTDAVGSDQDNLVLSQARATAVVQYLIERGVDKVRMRAKGYGETAPVASNDTKDGRQLNRRTEFKIMKF